MKINELISEHSVDEGVIDTVGKAWGGLSRGVGAAVGGLAGTWDAAKQGYAAGKSAVTGKNPDGTPVTTSTQGGTTTPAPTQGGTTTPAPTQGGNTTQGGTTTPAPTQGGTTTPAQTDNAPAAEPTAPAAPAAEPAAPAAPAGMKADEIVKGLSDVWGKARASQDSMTGAPAVQQQIRAMGKEAGMAGQTFENRKSKKSVVEFRSNFLGMKI